MASSPDLSATVIGDPSPAGSFSHPYASFLKEVAKPARYIGGESGQRRKNWDSVQCRVCLAFPDLYDIGMSHLGYRILYKLLNDNPGIAAERCYAPWTDMHQQLLAHGEMLRSLESARPLCDFDVVGFSLQYELTYTNVLSMLQLGGIPLRSEARSDADPLIIAGGPVATHAEPLAPFIDAFAIGDAEELAAEMAELWTACRARGLGREECLRKLSELSGVYVPSLYEAHLDPETGLQVLRPKPGAPWPIERRLVEDLSKFPFPDEGPVGGPEAIFDRVSIEVARGCTEGCRFCQAGMIYRPVREREPQEVVDTVLRALEKAGHDEVSLTALSTADVSCISPLIRTLAEKTAPHRVSLSVASLRAYGLENDLLDEMRKVRAGGLTFAPEAGTQRMRDVINKNVTEEQLLETAERVFSKGFDTMKLYFIIGLPTETDDDVLGIAQVARNALAVAKRLRCHRAKITVSVSTHVPKPHTPFQWCQMDSLDEIRRKQELLRQALRGEKRIGLRFHDSITSRLEGIFARGDRRLADTLEHAFHGGARFDSWEDQLAMDIWEKALEATEIDGEVLLGTLPVSARLPWDHFDIGLEQGFLQREYQKALRNRLSPPCGKVAGTFIHHTNLEQAQADGRKLVCYDCGVACDMTHMRERRLQHLSDMDALRPPGARALPVVAGQAPEGPPRKGLPQPEQSRPPQPAGERAVLRLSFEKLGAAALLGHLDFMRELGRVLRRAGLRPAYSQGFRPKAKLSFGPALALGVASLDEKLDVELIDPPSPEEILRRLNQATGAGLHFTAAERITQRKQGIGALVCGARYLLVFSAAVLPQRELERKVAEFRLRSTVHVKRQTKGIGRLIDVKKAVLDVACVDPASADLQRAGLVGALSCVRVETKLDEKGSVKPIELVEALIGDPNFPHQAIREQLLLRRPISRATSPAPLVEMSAPSP